MTKEEAIKKSIDGGNVPVPKKKDWQGKFYIDNVEFLRRSFWHTLGIGSMVEMAKHIERGGTIESYFATLKSK